MVEIDRMRPYPLMPTLIVMIFPVDSNLGRKQFVDSLYHVLRREPEMLE